MSLQEMAKKLPQFVSKSSAAWYNRLQTSNADKYKEMMDFIEEWFTGKWASQLPSASTVGTFLSEWLAKECNFEVKPRRITDWVHELGKRRSVAKKKS